MKMAFVGVICLIVLTTAKGAWGCSFANLNIPVVPFCKNHIRNGKAIVVVANEVPQNQDVDCICDAKVTGTEELLVNYESPDYTNCGVELQIENMLYSCQDSITNIDVSDKPQFKMMYKKTTSTSNPNICILLKSISNVASSITVTCYESDEQPVTNKPTTWKTSRTTTSPKQTQLTDRQISSESTLSTPLPSNNTSDLKSVSTYKTKTSEAGITSPHNSSFSTTDTWVYSSTTSEYFNITQSTRYKSESSTNSKFITDIPKHVSDTTTFKHLTSEITKEISFGTSTPNPSSSTILGQTEDWSDSTIDALNTTAAEGTTTLSNRQSREEIQLRTVIIICSVLGCILLMSIAVALSIIIYKNRTKTLKNSFSPDIEQSYINAFDQERRESKDDGVLLNNVLLTDHVNDPSKRIYSIPRDVKCSIDKSSKSYNLTDIDVNPSVQITDTLEEESFPPTSYASDGEMRVSVPRRSLRTSTVDTSYDHIDIRGQNASAKVLQDSDLNHYNDVKYEKKESETYDWKSTNYIDNGGKRDPLTELSTSPFGGGEKHYQTRTGMNERNGANDIYTIVRKPRGKDQQKQRPKLVTFKGFDDVEEETNYEPIGTMKNRSTEMHDGGNQQLYDNKSLYNSTKIPRVTLDKDCIYSTVAKVNRSNEEKVFQD